MSNSAPIGRGKPSMSTAGASRFVPLLIAVAAASR
jgi:hypothetical protein